MDEYQKVDDAFTAHGFPIPPHTAYPYGEFDDHVESVTRMYRVSARTVQEEDNTWPIRNWYEVNAMPVEGE